MGPPVPVNGGPVPVFPVAPQTGTGATGTRLNGNGGLRRLGLRGPRAYGGSGGNTRPRYRAPPGRPGHEDNHARSSSARVHHGRSAGSPRGETCAGRAARELNAMVMAFRRRSRRPVAMSLKKSLGQRRGMERAPRWPQRQPRQVRQRAHAPWAAGRFSTGRSARGLCATGAESFGCVVSKPQPPTWRGVAEEEPQPTAWDETRPALAAKTTTPSPPARACSVGGRPVLHEAKRARAVRHGS